jgi:hypothetical protein
MPSRLAFIIEFLFRIAIENSRLVIAPDTRHCCKR